MKRPALAPDLDPSRAADRAADPSGWRMDDASRAALAEVITGRRDIRRFRPDPVPEDALARLLDAAHRAPSVGLSQPWRFVVVRSVEVRAQVRALCERERLRQAPRFDARARHFLDQKVEGVLEAPVGIAVCCVPPPDGVEVLGRGTIPATDLHSTVCAIQNLWLTARAEGLGVGWVSFYRPDDLRAVLGIPADVDPVAWLCVGWPDERPTRPGLERAGWAARRPVDDVVFAERWPSEAPAHALAPAPAPDARARVRARDVADRQVRPAGSLGALEELAERWAAATGAPPPAPLRAAHLIVCADHGHVARGSSLHDATVTSDLAATAAAGETAIGVLARARGERLVVADVGLRGAVPPGLVDAKIAHGSADLTAAPALGEDGARAAMDAGAQLLHDLIGGGVKRRDGGTEPTPSGARGDGRDGEVEGIPSGASGEGRDGGGEGTSSGAGGEGRDGGVEGTSSGAGGEGRDGEADGTPSGGERPGVVVLGEIGIGNTATSAALLAALTGAAPEDLVGRGTGLDAQGLARRRALIAAGVERHRAACGEAAAEPMAALAGLGGHDLAALAGAILAAHDARVPVLLDGLAVGVAALVATRLRPAAREWLFAGHRSAEPAHALVLTELGLEPLLDLRLRLGEGSGAALALPLVEAAGRLHRGLGTFDEPC